MKKRILASLMAVCFVVMMLPTVALASGETEITATTETLTSGNYILNSDVTLTKENPYASNTEAQTLSGQIEIPEDAVVTIDLNGHKLISTYDGISILNKGTLTINDSSEGKTGVIYNSNSTALSYYSHDVVRNFGTLIINGGTFGDADTDRTNDNSSTWGAAVRNQAGASCAINGGFFTCCDNYQKLGNDSIFSYAIRNFGTMEINDGTVYGKMNGGIAADGGTITINDGDFSVTGSNTYYVLVTNTSNQGKIVVNGGTFTKINDTNNRILGGFGGMPSWNATDSVKTLEENGYTVTGGTFVSGDTRVNLVPVAAIGDTKYFSLETALAEVANDNTVTLLTDATITETVSLDKSITLDLGGYTVTADEAIKNSMFTRTGDDSISVTVKNGSITNENKDGSGFVWNGGSDSTLTLDNVKLTTEARAINVQVGTVTVSKDTTVTGHADDSVIHVGQSGTLNVYGAVSCTDEDYAIYSDSSDAIVNIYPGAEVCGEELEAIYLNDEATLNIYGGTIICNGEWAAIGLGEADEDDEEDNGVTGENISISGGSFSSSVAEYVVPTLNYEANNNGIYTYHAKLDEAMAAGEVVKSVAAANADEETNTITVTLMEGSNKTEIEVTAEPITLPTLNNYGYNYFQGWTDGAGNFYRAGESVTITANTTFTAQWVYIPPVNPNPSYSITAPSTENGTLSVSPASATKNTDVTITVTPDKDYELASLTVTDANGNRVPVKQVSDNKFTFTMPASKVTVNASFSKVVKTLPFTDVSANDYFFDAVVWAVENGVTYGNTATTFGVGVTCNRADAVTFIWRAYGCPAPKNRENPFTDVADSAYYADAVLWAVENGITVGTSATTFSPLESCRREHIVTFLYRAAGSPTVSHSSGFTDVADSAYYANAVTWAAENGITVGAGSTTTFGPTQNCFREQIVTFLYRNLAE